MGQQKHKQRKNEQVGVAGPLVSRVDFSDLLTALQQHIQVHQSLPEGDEARQADVLRAVCLTLIVGPVELGQTIVPSPLRDEAYTVLQDVGEDDGAEARVCRLWLASALGEEMPDWVDAFAQLAQESLWAPVQALVYRALAYYGRRGLLAQLLPEAGSLSLVQAEAWLEASHSAYENKRWVERVDASSCSLLPATLNRRWETLIRAEAMLARGRATQTGENLLTSLIEANDGNPNTYIEAESWRLSMRAVAALARSRVGRGFDNGDVLATPAGQRLPVWEREYLHALGRWQLDRAEAVDGLRTALGQNPAQTAIRYALAACLAKSAPEETLDILGCDNPTREVLVTRAILLAQKGCYGEAERELAHCENGAYGREAMRYSWARGHGQLRQRECALRAALAAQRGDWQSSEQAWAAADFEKERKALHDARSLFATKQELLSLPDGQAWRRSVLEQRLRRGRHEVGSVPLMGNALFFRAAAMVDTQSERMVRDCQTLLQRVAWIGRERSVGGARILFVGDLLLRCGQIGDALRAYELMGQPESPTVQQRLAVALVAEQVVQRTKAEGVCKAVAQAEELAPDNPWPSLLAALGLLIDGEIDSARMYLDAAEEHGAPESTCRCLRAVCSAVDRLGTDYPTDRGSMTDEDLAAQALQKHVTAVVRFVCGQDALPARISTLVDALGDDWFEYCPTEPEFIACWLLAASCEAERWNEALSLVDRLAQSERLWAKDLVALTRIRHALANATQGNWEEAASELRDLELSDEHLCRWET
jgi:hypothetical protein